MLSFEQGQTVAIWVLACRCQLYLEHLQHLYAADREARKALCVAASITDESS